MTTRFRFYMIVVLVVAGFYATHRVAHAQTPAELDLYWSEVSRTVAEGDFQGYAALYHEDAVLVTSDSSFPIASALAGWEQDFVGAKSGSTKNTVDFRFSRQVSDATTAHEIGVFRYSLEAASGEVTVQFVRFEALLVKRNGWKMLMEYQRAPATADDWHALADE